MTLIDLQHETREEREREMYDCCESRVKKNEVVVQIVKRFCITREEPERNKDRTQSSVKCMILYKNKMERCMELAKRRKAKHP